MFQEALNNIPWLQVFVAAVAYFALGAIWYGPLFSKIWIRGHKINTSDPDLKKGMAATMIFSFLILVVICIALAIVKHVAFVKDWEHGAKWGAFLGCGFALTSTSMSYLYLKKPYSIHLIDGLYHVTGMTLAMVIMTAWQ